jgi:hypothetical protein
MDDLRYPIGRFEPPTAVSEADRVRLISEIDQAPSRLREAVGRLTPAQLDTVYRPGGWTVRQVVHHLADSHINGYTRFRLALTEDSPTIKPYAEARWAELADSRRAPIELSLTLLATLHARWTMMMGGLAPTDWARAFRHPEDGLASLDVALAKYAWHGRHHIAQITRLRERMGW